jgi:hypothetical protein
MAQSQTNILSVIKEIQQNLIALDEETGKKRVSVVEEVRPG